MCINAASLTARTSSHLSRAKAREITTVNTGAVVVWFVRFNLVKPLFTTTALYLTTSSISLFGFATQRSGSGRISVWAVRRKNNNDNDARRFKTAAADEKNKKVLDAVVKM